MSRSGQYPSMHTAEVGGGALGGGGLCGGSEGGHGAYPYVVAFGSAYHPWSPLLSSHERHSRLVPWSTCENLDVASWVWLRSAHSWMLWSAYTKCVLLHAYPCTTHFQSRCASGGGAAGGGALGCGVVGGSGGDGYGERGLGDVGGGGGGAVGGALGGGGGGGLGEVGS